MSTRFQRITPFLWFGGNAEEAANFYVSVFDNSAILATTRYNSESAQASGMSAGSVMTVGFQLDGQDFTALNGGPIFQFNESISLVVHCKSQAEVDRYWSRLSEGGDPKAQVCGWLKDKYGLSWQIVPDEMIALLSDPDPDKARRTMSALMQMRKIDLGALRAAVG